MEINEATSEATVTIEQELKDKYFNFQKATIDLNYLVSGWARERHKSVERRNLREINIDISEERRAGRIKHNETFIKIRTINANIEKEQPPLVKYLKQSHRIAIFKCLDEPTLDTQIIERDFTDGMTYEDWEIPFFKSHDGAATHGWDSVEIVYDTSKPLNVGIEHIGHERLIFSQDCLNIQFAPWLIREYDFTVDQLKNSVLEFGFDLEQVNIIVNNLKDKQGQTTIKIYKAFFRWQKVVHVVWFASQECSCQNWLKVPSKLFLGIKNKIVTQQQVPQQSVNPITGLPEMTMVTVPQESWEYADINMYPVFLLPYRVTEEDVVINNKGRVFLDEYDQEAMTSIATSLVNGIFKASNSYASLDSDSGDSAQIKELQDLSPDTIINKPLRFFHQDYPDQTVLTVLQWLDTKNSSERGDIAWAVQNRKDSRKTATEISEAKEQTDLLNSVQMVLFSTFARKIWSFVWKMVQSMALQGVIKFYQIDFQKVNDPMTGQEKYIKIPPRNNVEVIGLRYSIKAAGDIDVIERDNELAKMMQIWPLIAQTPLALEFLKNILRVAFPNKAEKWIQFMDLAIETQRMQEMKSQQNKMEEEKMKEMEKMR